MSKREFLGVTDPLLVGCQTQSNKKRSNAGVRLKFFGYGPTDFETDEIRKLPIIWARVETGGAVCCNKCNTLGRVHGFPDWEV